MSFPDAQLILACDRDMIITEYSEKMLSKGQMIMELDRILFTGNWLFSKTEDENAVRPDYDDSAFEHVTLPHDWQILETRIPDAKGGGSQGFFPREHMGVYRKHFSAPEEWKNKQIRLLFDGVQRFSTVYLNGKKVGGRPFGYVPFICDLTENIDFENENILSVSVDNREPEGMKLNIAGGDRWYSGAGIYRNVWILADENTHIANGGINVVASPVLKGPSGDVPDKAGIRCDRADVVLTCEIEGETNGFTVEAEISYRGETLLRLEKAASPVTVFRFEIPSPNLWSPETPNLYEAKISIRENGDAHKIRFGVRSAEFDEEDGFLLNGVKTKLWGVNLHHDGGCVGAAVPIEIWERRLKAIKKLGANTIRASHNPMAEELYDLCDEMGFLVIDEIYDKWSDNNMYGDLFFDEWHDKDISAMIRRDRCHPSVILWSVGNEIGHQYSEIFYECLKDLVDHVRAIDNTRAVSCALIGFCTRDYNDVTPMGKKLAAVRRYAEIVDVFMGNYLEHFYEKLRESGMRKPIIGSEVRNYYILDENTLNNTQYKTKSPFHIVNKHDWVCGSLIWAGIDYLGEGSMWPLRGWTGDLLDSTGDWKLRAWYCAAAWKNEPVIKVCVYDETEPWDGSRGAWGFPQMRSHWKYTCFEKILHVAVMTNCDTVKLYQNSQTARVGYLKDSEDGMIHFYVPYIPGVLRAEGYRGGLLVCEDILRSDHNADTLRVEADRLSIPADGTSVSMIDLILEDKYAKRYMLENRRVSVKTSGAPVRILMDNGDAWSVDPFEKKESSFFNGHILIVAQAGTEKGETEIEIEVDGFAKKTLTLEMK